MTDVLMQWTQSFKGLDPAFRHQLLETLKVEGLLNGHAAHVGQIPVEEATELHLVRPSAQDLLITPTPLYVDVFGLHQLYDKLLFGMNLLVKGPKGNGKTLSLFSWFSQRQIPVVVAECSEETKKTEIVGSHSMAGDRTLFVLGVIATAIDVANETGACGLVFEELNALPPPIQKMLNSILDFRKQIHIPQIKRTFKLREGARLAVAATMNPSVYGGTYDLNEDLKSRVEEIEVGYPPASHEMHILKATLGQLISDQELGNVVKFAHQTRQQATGYALSTRDIVRLAQTISAVGLQNALQLVICKFEGDDRDTVVKRIGAVWGTPLANQLKKHWGAP